jgi:Cu/Ag efflux protein CusF
MSILMAWLVLAMPQAPTGITQQVFEISGQVDRIDRAGRTVSITSAGVVSSPIYAGPDLPIFDQLNTGDVVTVRFYDSVIVEVTPGERMTPMQDTTAEAQRAVERPDAAVMQQTRLVVTIDSIDVNAGSVTYHGFDNRRVFRVVRDRRLLDGVKAGDIVTITFTRAQAVAISKQ